MSIRILDKPRKTTLLATDAILGTDSVTGSDIHATLEDVAEIVRVLIQDALVTPDDRTKIDTPVPVVALKRKFYRGEPPPAIDYNNANPGPGWVDDPGVGTGPVYEISATLNNGVFIPPWSSAIKISGEDGLPGLPGDDGVDGTPGNANRYYFQDAWPTTSLNVNDVVWRPSENYKQYRWNGTTWVPSFQPFLTTDEAGRVTGLVRAGESDKSFVLVADRFQIWDGASAYAPFEVIDNVTYIKEAVIRQVAAAKIIGGNITGQEFVLYGVGARIRSSDYVAGVSGWQISGTGAEFPALIVRSGQIEANAATRRYGASFGGLSPYSASTWAEIASVDVEMESGNTAQVFISFQHIQNTSAPYATDLTIRLKRANGSVVGQVGQTVRNGVSTLVTYFWYDTEVTTKYSVELQSAGGPGGASLPNIIAIIYRK
jgi:hypothetical protein